MPLKNYQKNSYIEIADKDIGLYESGCFITRVTMLKNRVRVKFEEDYLSLFTGLTTNFITMWSTDIFQMQSKRSVTFYEYLREHTDTRKHMNSIGLGIKAIKDLLDIPKESYMRAPEKGGFNRPQFEKGVIDPMCRDLLQTKMITLVVQPNGKLYEKVKHGNRVAGYCFYWTYSSHPAVATAPELAQIQKNVDKNPEVLKIAKDLLKGRPKKKSCFGEFITHDYDIAALEQSLLKKSY